MRQASREALELLISCVGLIGLLAGFPGLSVILNGPIGYILFAGAIIAALLFLIVELRRGSSLPRSAIELGLVGGITFGSVYGAMWYFMSYLPASGGFADLASFLETPATVSDDFMTYLKSSRYPDAFNLLSPDLKNQLGSAANFQDMIKNSGSQPVKWTWTSKNVSTTEGRFDGNITFAGNRDGTVSLVVSKPGNRWKISNLSIRNK